MLNIINSTSLLGIEGYRVEVQVDVVKGKDEWEIVGMPDVSIKEASERVRAAVKNSGFALEYNRVLINLAPAEIKKEGSGFDLAMAVGVLAGNGFVHNLELDSLAFLGELSLDGKVNSISGILPPSASGYQNRNPYRSAESRSRTSAIIASYFSSLMLPNATLPLVLCL